MYGGRMGSRKPVPHSPSASAKRCRNLYHFIRLRLGEDISDREVARRWGMEWKSFVGLKHGRRRMPRLEELERLSLLLEVDANCVFQVARGVAAKQVSALLRRERRLEALLERVVDAIFTVDEKGRLHDVTQRFCALLGYGPEELRERPLADFVTVESSPRLAEALATAMRDGEARGAEVVLRDAKGRERIVQLDAASVADVKGRVIGVQAVARDVTDQRRMLREFDEQRRLIETMYRCVPSACILFDRAGTILAANPVVERVCPATAAEMVGRNASEIFGDPGPAGCPVTRAFLTGLVEQQVSWLTNRAGQRVYVHRTAGPVMTDGRVEKVIEIMVDVTGQLQSGDLRVLALWRGQPDRVGGLPVPTERRTAPRARTTFEVRFACGDRRGTAKASSLGSGGLFLEGPIDGATVGSAINVEWSLPGDDTQVQTQGVVAWTRASSAQNVGGLGVRFLSVNPDFAPVTQSMKKLA